MDLSSVGTQYLNSQYIPLSNSDPVSQARNSMENGSFEDVLKKVKNIQAQDTNEPVSRTKKLSNTPIDKNDKLYEACMELETFLIKNLIKSMRSTVMKTNLIDTGFAGGMYEDMLYDEYAKDFAKNANLGFAEMAYRELAGLR